MISAQLKHQVEQHYQRARVEYPLYAKARTGELTAPSVKKYISGLHYLLTHTPIYLALAQKHAEQKNFPAVAEYFAKKRGEEEGHDEWASADITGFEARLGVQGSNEVVPAFNEWVNYLRSAIERDPRHYVAYIFLAEYFLVLIGPEWISNLEKNCSIPADLISVVGNHVELDKEHVADGLAEVDTLLAGMSVEDLTEVIDRSMDFFRRVNEQVTDV